MVYVCSIYFLCEPLKVGQLPYPFPQANVAKIIRWVSLQCWSFFFVTLNSIQCFLEKRFSWPGLFRTWFIFSDWFLHVSFSRFQYSKVHFGSLLHCFIKLSFSIGYSFAKDFCPCLLLFICKELLSILGFCYMFTKDHGPCLPVYLQRTTVFISHFVYKGPQSLSSAIHLQRTAVLVLRYSFSKDAVLVLCYLFAKDAALVLGYLFAKDCGPCLMLFICKRPWYLFCIEKTAFPVIHLLSPQDKMDRSPGKAWGAAYPSGLVKTTVSQIST